MGAVEEDLEATVRAMVRNVYLRASAEATGRTVAQVHPAETQALFDRFEGAIEHDAMLLLEVARQFRMMGLELDRQEVEFREVVFDTDEER